MLLSKKIQWLMLTMALVGAAVSGFFIIATAPTTAPATPTTPAYVDAGDTELPSLPFPLRTVDEADTLVPTLEETAPVEQTTPVTSVAPKGVFSFPTVGMTAPLSTTTTVNGEVTPPDFNQVFRITDVSAPNVYVAHSCVREQCLGNALFNTDTQEVLVQTGDTVHVDGKTYKVTATRKVGKDALPTDPIWGSNDVAFVTCFQKTDRSPSTDNLVVVATLVD